MNDKLNRLMSEVKNRLTEEDLKILSEEELGVLDEVKNDNGLGENTAIYEPEKDNLGREYCRIVSPKNRRNSGTFFTDQEIVEPMVEWVLSKNPDYVIDAGAGSGRFSMEVLKRSRNVKIIAVENNPILSLLTRVNLKSISERFEVWNKDFLNIGNDLNVLDGKKAFIGNPPYVRHHFLDEKIKNWAKEVSEKMNLKFSRLSGLHAYFYLATATYCNENDFGTYITSAEWLDNGYGKKLKRLLIKKLGLKSIDLLVPTSEAFSDAMTTAVITCFDVGKGNGKVNAKLIKTKTDFEKMTSGEERKIDEFDVEKKWSKVIKKEIKVVNKNHVRLGKFARVHRGIATGSNNFFLVDKHEVEKIGNENFFVPCISSAKEVLNVEEKIREKDIQKYILNIPAEYSLEELPENLRTYIKQGEERGINEGYICSNREPWWSIRNVNHLQQTSLQEASKKIDLGCEPHLNRFKRCPYSFRRVHITQ